MIPYVTGAGNTPSQEEFVKTVKKLEFVNEEKIMSTILEYLKPELLKRASAQALEEGLEKGRKERDTAVVNIAKALLLKGMNIEAVAETTNLSKKEVKKLLN